MPLDNEKPEESGGVWIFVSHSNRDIVSIRAVRNELEALGHFPLLFFLRCLDDEEEISDLIKREIEAREFFLLCDSPHARAASWVQREIAYIKSLNRVFETVDLEAPLTDQLRAIHRLSRRATLFLSYHTGDVALVDPIQQRLARAQYRIWRYEDEMETTSDLGVAMEHGIQACLQNGFFLLFITPRSNDSPWIRAEWELALRIVEGHADHRIVPILLGNVQADDIPSALKQVPHVDLRALSDDEAAQTLIRHLRAL